MAHAEHHHHHVTLNTDGQAHPLENTLTATVALLASVAIVTAFFASVHVITSWVGLAGFVTGIYAQYLSATTAERWVIIVGWGASGIGLAIGLANGGLW